MKQPTFICGAQNIVQMKAKWPVDVTPRHNSDVHGCGARGGEGD